MRMFYPKLRGRSVYFCLVILSFLSFQTSFSQEATKLFRGTVTDSKGAPLSGASIVVKGTTTGTTSGTDGSFSIQAAPNATIQITNLDFQMQEIVLKGNNAIQVQLSPTNGTSLNEVVVVAYGTQRKADITGSVAIVNVTEAKKFSTNDVAQLLQGRAAGVQVNTDGQPGATPSVRIRGIGTFGNAQPLYVIDGVQVGTVVRDFSPNDIESIQVLKDASSAALYGSQAANGVIIITTKQGRKNTPMRIEYNGYYGIDKVWQRQPVTNREQYQLLNNEARRNAGGTVVIAPGNNPASPVFINNVDVDWQKEGLKQGNRTNHNLAFSGGGNSSQYNLSLDYFDNNGTYVGNGPDYKRYTVRMNSSAEKGIFKIGENIFYANSRENVLASTTANDLAGALPPLINTLVFAVPTMKVRDPNRLGGYGGTETQLQDVISFNGIGYNSLLKSYVDVDRIFANVYGEIQLLKTGGHNLKYRLNLSYDKTQTRDYNFKPGFDLGYFFQSPIAKLDDNSRTFNTSLVENILTYQKAFGKHGLELLAGQTFRQEKALFRFGHSEGFTEPYLPVLDNGPSNRSASGFETEAAIVSYLGRLNYNFDDRYLITANIRRDASSRFGPANKVGYFPSVSLGWRVTNEGFFKVSKDVITDLKIRAGYGVLGRDNIGDYLFQADINSGIVYSFNGVRSVGGLQTSVVDPNIKWEERTSSNIGLDATLMKGKLDFTAEYYNNKSVDILVGVPIPASVGSLNSAPITNAGSLQNSGFEFSAVYHKNRGAFTFDINANFTTLKNEVLSLGGNNEPINGVGSRTLVGGEVGRHYGFVYEGIFQTAAEVAASAFQTNRTVPGDIKFKDISGPQGKPDGVINDAYDRTFLGSAIPKYNFGFGLNAGYKGFDFSVFASGSAKFLINSRLYRDLMHTGGSANYRQDMLNRWTPQNTSSTIPRLNSEDPNNNGRDSDRPNWLQDGTYLRINTLSLGYNFKAGIVKGITKARIYVTAQNLYTFQGYKGYNPDFTSGVFNPGFDGGSYPRPRTIMAGVQVGF